MPLSVIERDALASLEWILWLVFAAEFATRWYIAMDRRTFVKHNLIDLAVVALQQAERRAARRERARQGQRPELPYLPDDRERAPNTRGRGREGREEPIARRIDLMPAVALQLTANLRMVTGLQFPPPSIAELDSHLARTDDVGEQQRGQPAFVLTPEHHRWSVRPLRAELNSQRLGFRRSATPRRRRPKRSGFAASVRSTAVSDGIGSCDPLVGGTGRPRERQHRAYRFLLGQMSRAEKFMLKDAGRDQAALSVVDSA
jgi:hypothetical protein